MCCAVLSCSVLSDFWDPIDYSLLGSSVLGNSPGKNTGVDCHALLQRIFPTQGSNPGLLHCRQILYYLSYREALWMSVWRKAAHVFVRVWVSMWLACMWVNVLRIYVCMRCVHKCECMCVHGLPRRLSGKEPACDAGDTGSVPVLGRSPGGRKWQCTVGRFWPLSYLECNDEDQEVPSWASPAWIWSLLNHCRSS